MSVPQKTERVFCAVDPWGRIIKLHVVQYRLREAVQDQSDSVPVAANLIMTDENEPVTRLGKGRYRILPHGPELTCDDADAP